MSDRRPEHEGSIPAEDVDDVVGVASELEESAQHRVRIGEMKEIAEDLRIDPQFVEPAIETLAQRRAAAEAARATRSRGVRRVAIALAIVLACAVAATGWTRSVLAPRWAEVERARSQVETVIGRRERVEAIWLERPSGIDRDAELAGAENRVGVERGRYDEAAAAYNATASALPHALLCGVAGVPCHAPLASEITAFSSATAPEAR